MHMNKGVVRFLWLYFTMIYIHITISNIVYQLLEHPMTSILSMDTSLE